MRVSMCMLTVYIQSYFRCWYIIQPRWFSKPVLIVIYI